MIEEYQQQELEIVEIEIINEVNDERVVAMDPYGTVKLEWIHLTNAFVENSLTIGDKIDFKGFLVDSTGNGYDNQMRKR